MAKVNYAKYIILGMLSSGPMSGYDVRNWVKSMFIYLWDIGYGQIYPTLSVLEQEGLATMHVEQPARGPSRKVYEITDRGRKELQAWLKAPEKKEYELLLKICFGSQIDNDVLINKLEAYAAKRELEFQSMDSMMGVLSDGQSYGPNTAFYHMIVDLGLAYYKDEIAWCRRSVDTLHKLREGGQDDNQDRQG